MQRMQRMQRMHEQETFGGAQREPLVTHPQSVVAVAVCRCSCIRPIRVHPLEFSVLDVGPECLREDFPECRSLDSLRSLGMTGLCQR